MAISRAIIAAGLVAFSVNTATAEDIPVCADFAWSVARERAAFGAPDLPALTSGSALPGNSTVGQLTLKPVAEIALPVRTDKEMRPGTFAGFVTATVPAAGTYQVTLSNEAWIDVSQDGRSTLKPAAHSGKAGCPDVRKSVRFALDVGPVTVEISRASGPQIKLGLLKAE